MGDIYSKKYIHGQTHGQIDKSSLVNNTIHGLSRVFQNMYMLPYIILLNNLLLQHLIIWDFLSLRFSLTLLLPHIAQNMA